MKQTNIFGFPVTVGSYDELCQQVLADPRSDGTYAHVCPRVADSTAEPYPALKARRIKVRCDKCREPCWFDYKSAIPGLKGVRICLQCFMGNMQAGKKGHAL